MDRPSSLESLSAPHLLSLMPRDTNEVKQSLVQALKSSSSHPDGRPKCSPLLSLCFLLLQWTACHFTLASRLCASTVLTAHGLTFRCFSFVIFFLFSSSFFVIDQPLVLCSSSCFNIYSIKVVYRGCLFSPPLSTLTDCVSCKAHDAFALFGSVF